MSPCAEMQCLTEPGAQTPPPHFTVAPSPQATTLVVHCLGGSVGGAVGSGLHPTPVARGAWMSKKRGAVPPQRVTFNGEQVLMRVTIPQVVAVVQFVPVETIAVGALQPVAAGCPHMQAEHTAGSAIGPSPPV